MKPAFWSLPVLALASLGGSCEKPYCDIPENAEDEVCVCVDDTVTYEDDADCFCYLNPTAEECTGPALPTFVPTTVLVSGLFGYDAETGQARSYLLPDGTVAEPAMEILLITDDYDPTFEDTYCSVVLTYDTTANGPIDAGAWVAQADAADDQSVFFGFSFPDDATVDSDCNDKDYDQTLWGPDLVATVVAHGWGLGISTLDADIADAIQTQVVDQLGQEAWDQEWAPYVFGGGFEWRTVAQYGIPGGYMNSNFGNGFLVEEDWSLSYVDENDNGAYDPPSQGSAGDPLVRIEATDVTDGTPPSGVYSVRAAGGLMADCVADINNCLQ